VLIQSSEKKMEDELEDEDEFFDALEPEEEGVFGSYD
jgi:hypothetical protein